MPTSASSTPLSDGSADVGIRAPISRRASAAPGLLTMDESPEDRVQNMIELFANIFREEPQHEKSILLHVFVRPTGFRARTPSRAIDELTCAVGDDARSLTL